MIYNIANPYFEVGVHSVGAELCSFKSKQTGTEFIWKGDERIWGSTAPVLFPIIGALKGNSYIFNGKTYKLPKHGFVRHNEHLIFDKLSNTVLKVILHSSEDTLVMYPFEFRFEIVFELIENALHIHHKVINKGMKEMLFSLGGHPAINCPIYKNEKYSDYYVDFHDPVNLQTHLLSADGLVTSNMHSVLVNERALDLTENLFDKDALIFKNISSKVATVKSKNHQTEVTFKYPDFTNLGIWAKPKAPFVCIEPWLGVADFENTSGNLSKKDGIITLPASQSFEASYSIIINE